MKFVGAAFVASALWIPLWAAGSAHADATQAAFVNQLQGHGIPGTSDELLNNGYAACSGLRNQTSQNDALTVTNLFAPRAGLPIDQAAYEVGAAIKWLCTEQVWQINELHDANPSVPGVTSVLAGYAGQ
jgi:hypothetical protein